MTDLAPLTVAPAWQHFANAGDDEAAALTRARAAIGPTHAVGLVPDDELKARLAGSAAYLEAVTQRLFVLCTGTVTLSGDGGAILRLPIAVASVSQGHAGVTAVEVGGAELDPEEYTVFDGVGMRPNDPRDYPRIELESAVAGGDAVGGLYRQAVPTWPTGMRNIRVTGEWGYLDRQGLTPTLVRRVLSMLVPRTAVTGDDLEGLEDLRAGAIVSETTIGRSYTLGDLAQGYGVTGTREIDLLLANLRRPSPPSSTRRGRRRRRPPLLEESSS